MPEGIKRLDTSPENFSFVEMPPGKGMSDNCRYFKGEFHAFSYLTVSKDDIDHANFDIMEVIKKDCYDKVAETSAAMVKAYSERTNNTELLSAEKILLDLVALWETYPSDGYTVTPEMARLLTIAGLRFKKPAAEEKD